MVIFHSYVSLPEGKYAIGRPRLIHLGEGTVSEIRSSRESGH